MVHHLLADAVETGVLCQIGDVAVHLSIHFDVLHHVLAIGLQAAVEVVQVLDAAYLACRGVKQFGGQCLRQGVIPLLLIARNKVIPVYLDHLEQGWNLVGRVLKVGIHRNHHVALSLLEAAIKGRTLAVIAAKLDAVHLGMRLRQFLNHVPRMVGGTVVHKNHFKGEVVGVHHTLNPSIQFRQRLFFVIQGDYNRYVHSLYIYYCLKCFVCLFSQYQRRGPAQHKTCKEIEGEYVDHQHDGR